MSSDPGGAVFDMYHATYHDYLEDATVGVKVYLVVKDGEARWGWWDKAKQKWMMTWAELPRGLLRREGRVHDVRRSVPGRGRVHHGSRRDARPGDVQRRRIVRLRRVPVLQR